MKSVAADHHIEICDTIRTLVFDLYDQSREYGKVNPDTVLKFVETADLKPLSKHEAIRRLI